MTSPSRTPTPIDAVADDYVVRLAELSPQSATDMGLPGHDHELDDLSPAGHDAVAQAGRDVLARLEGLEPADDVDRVTLSAMRERIGLDLELHEAGEGLRSLNNIESPVQQLRDIFDIMPTDSVEGWENIASRLNALPGAVEGYIESLRVAADQGNVAAIRQVREGMDQARELAGKDSFFTAFTRGAAVDAVLDESAACSLVRKELEHGATAARGAYAQIADFLEQDLAPQAPAADAVGRDRYALWSRYFLGATVDLDETYEWGLEELARIVAEQESVAAQIAGPGASVEQAVAVLNADPARKLLGTAALKEWMHETAHAAIAELNGTHFDVPEPVLDLECLIAPTQSGGIYYTPPSDDWSRPGRMWWSVPEGITEFNTWREKTTVYHEGVPGHHLQCGQAVFARETLNNWRRLACWVSGHGEGWALYAERLMAELGYLEDPGDRLGMLDAQRLRAARVVFDIGVHLGKRAPEQWGGGTWTAEKAWTFLRANVNESEQSVRFEFNRYLGWPGQAPSYKVGQRLWEQTRDAAKAAEGDGFDAKAFHARALNLGSVGLDTLREALA